DGHCAKAVTGGGQVVGGARRYNGLRNRTWQTMRTAVVGIVGLARPIVVVDQPGGHITVAIEGDRSYQEERRSILEAIHDQRVLAVQRSVRSQRADRNARLRRGTGLRILAVRSLDREGGCSLLRGGSREGTGRPRLILASRQRKSRRQSSVC